MEKSKAERTLEAKQKIRELVDWFTDRELPKGPISPQPFYTIIEPAKFVSTQIARLSTLDIFNKSLQAAYIHLTNFKKYLENAQPATANDNKGKRSKTN